MERFFRRIFAPVHANRQLHEDVNFMSEAKAAVRLSARWSASALLYAIAAFFVSFIAWASWAEVEQVTRAMGQVAPASETQLVQSLEGGILAALEVNEGDVVKKGQVLARVSNQGFASEEKGAQAKALALNLRKERLKAEIAGELFVPSKQMMAHGERLADNELALYQSRKEGLVNALSLLEDRMAQASASMAEVDAQIARFVQTRALLQKEVDMTTKMVAQGAAPKMQGIRLERELADLSGNLNAARQKKRVLVAEVSATKRERASKENAFRSEALTQLAGVEAELASLDERIKAASDRVDRAELRAPSNGIVKAIHLKTIGGVIEPAKVLMEIVPTDEALKIRARLSPTDIAFLRIGQPCRIKITAYDAQRYGTLEGTLTRVGADTVRDNQGNLFFEIDVATSKSYLGTKDLPLPIMPGMVAQVDVITGERTIMTYLLKPFLRVQQEALREP